MKVSVKNPAGRTKAVRGIGGLVVIKAGKSADVECNWDDAEKAKYEAAGLKIGKPDVAAKGNKADATPAVPKIPGA